MLDWLRQPPRPLTVRVAGRNLPLAIRRLAHARRMTLRLARDGSEARVSMPRWARDGEALAFARARADWLAAQVARLPQAAPAEPGVAFCFRGAQLIIRHDPTLPRRVALGAGEIVLGGPRETVAQRLKRWLQGEARALFAADLADYCARAGVALPALALSNAAARWGSCSRRGVVRLNWRLVMAPDAVRRSVVAHEVTHLVHFDHSPRFHALLARVYEGDIRAANAWLKAEGRALYAPFG